MKNKNTQKQPNAKRERLITASLGAAVGSLNGLFGAGGGMLVVPALLRKGETQRVAQATAIGVMLPLSVFSAIGHIARGGIPDFTLTTLAGSAVGAVAGAFLLGKISNLWLSRVFFALMAFAGFRILF